MTQEEFQSLSDTDRAFYALEGRCAGCGSNLKSEFCVHASWCDHVPNFIFHNVENGMRTTISTGRRLGKSVFANIVNDLNKIFGKTK